MAKRDGTRMAGEAVADNEEAVDAINRAASKKNPSVDYGLAELDAKQERFNKRGAGITGDSDLDTQGKKFYEKRSRAQDRQRDARQAMSDSGWDGDINSYDAKAYGSKGFDLQDIDFLKQNGVSEEDIQGYLKGLSTEERGGLRTSKEYGGDAYFGDIKDGDFSGVDFGGRITKRELNYMRDQGASEDDLYSHLKGFKSDSEKNSDRFGYRVHQFFDKFKSPGEKDPGEITDPTDPGGGGTNPTDPTDPGSGGGTNPTDPGSGGIGIDAGTGSGQGGYGNVNIDGSFAVGGDLIQTIGNQGDTNIDVSGSTFGDGAAIGNDYSNTSGNIHAGNTIKVNTKMTNKMNNKLFKDMKMGAFGDSGLFGGNSMFS